MTVIYGPDGRPLKTVNVPEGPKIELAAFSGGERIYTTGQKVKILVVHGEGFWRKTFGEGLEGRGYEVCATGSVQEARAILLKEKPHIVVASPDRFSVDESARLLELLGELHHSNQGKPADQRTTVILHAHSLSLLKQKNLADICLHNPCLIEIAQEIKKLDIDPGKPRK
jgi:CheY-like chemotaxis protein